MSEQERIILQYLENSYTGARMLDDISAMTRIARAIEAFEADPTEDIFAAEPRKGKWEEKQDNDWAGGGAWVCSECGYGYAFGAYLEAFEFDYCPNCGARMEESDE